MGLIQVRDSDFFFSFVSYCSNTQCMYDQSKCTCSTVYMFCRAFWPLNINDKSPTGDNSKKSHWAILSYNWRLRWKKGARIFTQNWTLSKTLQISHAVLFRCIKQCSVCFFAEVFFVYEILRMQKSLYLWCHQHVTGKTVISLKIQQNIDLLQRVTLKSVDFRVKPFQFWFHVNVRPKRR